MTTASGSRVAALRSTWRTTAEQKASQAWRFLRLALVALIGQVVAQLAANGFDLDKISHLDQKAIVALLVGAGEVAWRQLHPALTASAVDTAPGATIVAAPADADPGPDLGNAALEQVLLTAAAITLGLIVWSLIGAHTTLY